MNLYEPYSKLQNQYTSFHSVFVVPDGGKLPVFHTTSPKISCYDCRPHLITSMSCERVKRGTCELIGTLQSLPEGNEWCIPQI